MYMEMYAVWLFPKRSVPQGHSQRIGIYRRRGHTRRTSSSEESSRTARMPTTRYHVLRTSCSAPSRNTSCNDQPQLGDSCTLARRLLLEARHACPPSAVAVETARTPEGPASDVTRTLLVK